MDIATFAVSDAQMEVRTETGWCLVGCLPRSRNLTRFLIDREAFMVGRRPGAHLQVSSPKVSGKHAELLVIGHCLFIRDLGSTNGTYVNRRRVRQPTALVAGDHIEIADVEFRIERDGKPCRDNPQQGSDYRNTCKDLDSMESDWGLSQLDRLIRERAVTPHFQPIVALSDEHTTGYEALARSSMPGLENPAKMFDSARIAHREVELSLLCRQRAIEVAGSLPRIGAVFVNTHPNESFDVDVLPSVRTLRKTSPEVPVVVEVHEAAVHDAQAVREFRSELKDLGVQLAYDDFGAGRSRLIELVKAPPDYLKFDSSMIRHVDQASTHHWKMLETLVDMARGFDTQTLCEGVETREEADACRNLGFDLAQGYYYGRPSGVNTFSSTDPMIITG